MRRTSRAPTLLTAVLFLAVGCGTDDGDGSAAPAGEDAGQEDAAAGGEDAAAAAGDLRVDSSELGELLVDADGMTLYLFTNDSGGESQCEDDCAAAWPPLVVDGDPVPGEGVDASLLDTTERSDGRSQVTYAGWPLYTWAQDQQPGDVTGQGVQDVWFVVAPDGEPITGDGEGASARADGY
jgi:predicted lipoprotein with Yx(FWY)xxD motif